MGQLDEREGAAAMGHLDDRQETAVRAAVAAALQHGLEDASALDEDPASFLHLVAIAQVAADETGRLLGEAVAGARRAGNSWESLGRVLGVSRQAAQQRFGSTAGEPAAAHDRRVISGATAFNEMSILRREGRDGAHLVGFGLGKLVVEPSDRPWEHLRLVFASLHTLRTLEDEGWSVVGTWFPFTYLKRPAAPERESAA